MILISRFLSSHFTFNKKYILAIFLFSFFGHNLYCQSETDIDSLIYVLKTHNLTKKERAKQLSKIAYLHPIPEKSLNYAKESLEIAISINDEVLQAEALEEISHVERRLGNNAKSIEAALKALSIYKNLNLLDREAASYVQLASNFISDEDYTSAISNLIKASNIYKSNKNNANYASTIVNLGEAYRLSGVLDSAATQFKEAIRVNAIIDNDIIRAYASGNLGMVYSAKGNAIEAKKNLNEAISILKTLGDPYSSSIFLAELGNVYLNEGQLGSAENKFIEALNLAKPNGLKEQIRDFSKMLSSFYENKSDFKKALVYQKQYQIYQDSLINKEKIKEIEQIKTGFEIGLRETEIDKLNVISDNRKKITTGLIIGIAVLGVFLYLLSRANKNLKQQKELISLKEKEKALLLGELNHRVKNNLQMVSSLLKLQSNELSGHPAKDALIAGQYRVEALSLVHRKLYQDGVESKVQLNEYVEELVLGLLFSYGFNFKPVFDIEPISISIDSAVPISLIINELTTNAIKYAYQNNSSPYLKINIHSVDKRLIVDVIDNGGGFEQNENIKSNSFGIKLVSSLVEQLDGKMTLMNHKGTHWKLELKMV